MIRVKTIEGIGLACNTFIVTDCASGLSAIVDAGLSKEIFDQEAADFDIRYILLTHGHYDHISSADHIAERCKAELIIHENDKAFLQDSYLNLSAPFGFEPIIVNSPAKAVNDGDLILLGETEIKVMHTAGHTGGSVCFIAEDCMFCGDTLFNGSIGRTDFPTSDAKSMLSSLSSLSALHEDYKLYCGHGDNTTLEYQKKCNVYLGSAF